MSTDDYRGAAHAFKTFMQAAQRDIDTGVRQPAVRRFATADGRERLTWRDKVLARLPRHRRTA